MRNIVELPASQYVAVTGYDQGIPVFGKVIWASDQVAARNLLDLEEEFYIDVMLYVDTNQGKLFDDD